MARQLRSCKAQLTLQPAQYECYHIVHSAAREQLKMCRADLARMLQLHRSLLLTMLTPMTALVSSVCVARPIMMELAPPTASKGCMLMPKNCTVKSTAITTSTQLRILQRQTGAATEISLQPGSHLCDRAQHQARLPAAGVVCGVGITPG